MRLSALRWMMFGARAAMVTGARALLAGTRESEEKDHSMIRSVENNNKIIRKGQVYRAPLSLVARLS